MYVCRQGSFWLACLVLVLLLVCLLRVANVTFMLAFLVEQGSSHIVPLSLSFAFLFCQEQCRCQPLKVSKMTSKWTSTRTTCSMFSAARITRTSTIVVLAGNSRCTSIGATWRWRNHCRSSRLVPRPLYGCACAGTDLRARWEESRWEIFI